MTKIKFLIFLSFSGANNWPKSDLHNQAKELIDLYYRTPLKKHFFHTSNFFHTSSFRHIVVLLDARTNTTNPALRAEFKKAIKEAKYLLNTIDHIKRDSSNLNPPIQLFTIIQNCCRFIESEHDSSASLDISRDLSLLKEIQLPDDTLKLKPLIEQLKDVMKRTIQLKQKCLQLEEALKTDEGFLLAYAIKECLFQVYSEQDCPR